MRKLTKVEEANAATLKGAALFHVTPTFFVQSNPDCNAAMRDLLKRSGIIDYGQLEKGGVENKVFINGQYADGTEVKMSCYRTKSRGDKRINFPNLKSYADAGDIMALVVRRGKLVLQNITKGVVVAVLLVSSVGHAPGILS
jgi:hypothetical protein